MSKSGLDWIKANKDVLSIRGINTRLGMPNSTLTKAVDETQNLPKKWIEPVNEFVRTLNPLTP